MKDLKDFENINDILDVQSEEVKNAIKNMDLAMQEGDIETVEKIGEQEIFKKNAIIQFKMMQLEMQKGEYEKAQKIGSKRIFKNNPFIQEQLAEIEKKLEKEGASSSNLLIDEEQDEKQKFLNEIKTKLYYNRILQEDIESVKNNPDISEYERTCMLLAINAKLKDVKSAKQIAKTFKAQSENLEQNKMINNIVQKIENKKTSVFDMGIYDKVLEWEFDEELQSTYYEEQKKQQEEKKQLQTAKQVQVKSTRAKPSYYIPSYEINRRDFSNRIRVSPRSAINIEQEKKVREKNYYSEIKDYLDSKRKEIYVSMQSTNYEVQRDAISQWDKMELLIEKVDENKDNKEYLNGLHSKISQLQEKENGISR